ncbi:hypothetical protein ACHAXS_010264, partial [Conticribra weissflogii]
MQQPPLKTISKKTSPAKHNIILYSTMVFRPLLSKVILPNLEKDLSRTVGREVAKMDCVSQMAPQVYGYRPKIGSF